MPRLLPPFGGKGGECRVYEFFLPIRPKISSSPPPPPRQAQSPPDDALRKISPPFFPRSVRIFEINTPRAPRSSFFPLLSSKRDNKFRAVTRYGASLFLFFFASAHRSRVISSVLLSLPFSFSAAPIPIRGCMPSIRPSLSSLSPFSFPAGRPEWS